MLEEIAIEQIVSTAEIEEQFVLGILLHKEHPKHIALPDILQLRVKHIKEEVYFSVLYSLSRRVVLDDLFVGFAYLVFLQETYGEIRQLPDGIVVPEIEVFGVEDGSYLEEVLLVHVASL